MRVKPLQIAAAMVAPLVLLTAQAVAQDVSFTKTPALGQTAEKELSIDFELSEPTDVEVSVVCDWVVVRHLAAGLVGPTSNPPEPLARSLAQSLVWDGYDDYGDVVPDTDECWVRVAAGMDTSLDRSAGGDPYFFYSREMGQGDHAFWRVTGLEAKPDGKVYVMGNQTDYGAPTIRQYEPDGQYTRTVFPFRGDSPRSDVERWGLNTRGDGEWVPQYKFVSSPALSQTIISDNAGRISNLIPTADNDSLRIYLKTSQIQQTMTLATDGSLPSTATSPLVTIPPMPEDPSRLLGNVDVTPTPDGSSYYISGIFTASTYHPLKGSIDTTGFWRDGQIWKVDAATQQASVFYAIPSSEVVADVEARHNGPIATGSYNHYATFQGLALDAEGNVFIADRANSRVLVLNSSGVQIGSVPVAHPDDVAVDPQSDAIYVTSMSGTWAKRSPLTLHRFASWKSDTEPSDSIVLDAEAGMYPQRTHLAVTDHGGDTMVWAAYTTIPVRVYRDTGSEFTLERDFYQHGTQRFSDVQRMQIDPRTERVFLEDGYRNCAFLADWGEPVFQRCMVDKDTPVRAIGLAVDPRNRYLYTHDDRTPIRRYRLDGEFFSVDPITNSAPLTPAITNDWNIGLGRADRGLGVAPDGSVATLNEMGTGPDYTGPLTYFNTKSSLPWDGLRFVNWKSTTPGRAPRSGGVRFDPKGNMYVGRQDVSAPTPVGFEADTKYKFSIGRIARFDTQATEGNLFSDANAEPDHEYNISYGAFGTRFSRTPKFSVDGYGRILYPSALESKVSIVDNNGQQIHSLGVYGNLDETASSRGIVMAYPNSVDASEDFIYVSDVYNMRVLRIAKTYEADEIVTIDPDFIPRPKPKEPPLGTGGNGGVGGSGPSANDDRLVGGCSVGRSPVGQPMGVSILCLLAVACCRRRILRPRSECGPSA